MDWKVYDEQLDIPEGTTFFNLKIKSWPPLTGSSIVYFDDVGIIEWEEWYPFGNNVLQGVRLDSPNDYYYLQIRTQENLTGQEIGFNEVFYGNRTDSTDDLVINQCVDLVSVVRHN